MKQNFPIQQGVLAAAHCGQVIPLVACCSGDYMVVRDVAGGCGVRRRLGDMGFLPGERLTVVNVSGGPVIVMVRGARVCLGRGMAEKIMVVPDRG